MLVICKPLNYLHCQFQREYTYIPNTFNHVAPSYKIFRWKFLSNLYENVACYFRCEYSGLFLVDHQLLIPFLCFCILICPWFHFSTAITHLLANDNRGGRYSKNTLQMHHGNDSRRNKIGTKTSRPLLMVERMLKEAGLAGRNGEDCELTYPKCSALSDTDDYSMNGVKQSESFRLPYLVSPEHALAIIMGQSVG